jgi:WD40 repeat protein
LLILHGCSGHADVSPDEKTIAISNLYDGIEIYDISSAILIWSIKLETRKNDALPIMFLHHHSHILLTVNSVGRVRLWNTETGQPLHSLKNDGGWCCDMHKAEEVLNCGHVQRVASSRQSQQGYGLGYFLCWVNIDSGFRHIMMRKKKLAG